MYRELARGANETADVDVGIMWAELTNRKQPTSARTIAPHPWRLVRVTRREFKFVVRGGILSRPFLSRGQNMRWWRAWRDGKRGPWGRIFINPFPTR